MNWIERSRYLTDDPEGERVFQSTAFRREEGGCVINDLRVLRQMLSTIKAAKAM